MSFPTGGLRASKVIDGDTLQPYTTPCPTVEATFDSSVSIAAGSSYAIVVSAPDAAGHDASTGIGWRLWDESSGYTSGGSMVSANSGSTWADYGTATKYFYYITKAGAVEKDKPPLTGGASSVYFGGTTWFAQVFTAATSYSLTSVVLQIHKANGVNAGDLTVAIYGGYVFTPPTGDAATRYLVAVANNTVYYGTGPSDMAAVSGATVVTANTLTIANGFDKAFIANGTTLKVLDFANTKIATANVGTNAPDRGNILTEATSGATMVVDYITSTSSACTIYGKRTSTATFAGTYTITGTDDDGNAISFAASGAETAPPHWYTWTVYGADATNNGALPSNAKYVWRYRGRMGLAGCTDAPHNWWLSEVGNPFNILYDSTNPLTAVQGQNADAGEIGEIIRAVIPYGDDYCVFSGTSSIHLMNGDPAAGGSIDEITDAVGIFSWWSWCKDDRGNLYFYGTDGNAYIMQGGRSVPQCISAAHLPNLSTDFAANPSTHRVVLAFDPKRQGIILTRTTLASGVNTGYWYSLKTEGWYPESYPSVCGLYCSFFFPSNTSTNRGLLLGGADGYIREFKETAKDDDSGDTDTAISSYFACPVVPLGEDTDHAGKLTSITFDAAGAAASGDFSDTDGFSYELHVGNDAETVLEDIRDSATAAASGTVTGPGRKSKSRERVRGAYLGVKVYNSTAAQTFAVNAITAETKPAGKVRV
jgi:hypothetical protein